MSAFEALAVIVAGMAAGTINTIVGSGTLITFPTLLLLGVNPVTANMSNTVGLVAGGITGVHGYRKELVGARHDLVRLAPMTFAGAVVGAILLLVLAPDAFRAIVPVLILLGALLVLFGPRITALTARHRDDSDDAGSPWRLRLMQLGVFVAGVYGGYFGAAQGVLLMGIMSILSSHPIQRLNGYKNVLGTIANAVAAAVFIIVAGDRIDWVVAGLIAVGALIGGVIGSTVGRRLSALALRIIIAVIGVVAIVKVVWFP